ncbi:hypothetical protein [Colwellia sp. RSH04]|uniref:hypothetical protein n=1 Tax=Colwellia sp. RSH04 TaxID=2305464 RepID=UPI000E5841F0|nr:hypothetical protein [Colwellia sp. RSH04]RHW74877.1 hypothetical protein D1094_16505 [Colwellia sp. RSH04]
MKTTLKSTLVAAAIAATFGAQAGDITSPTTATYSEQASTAAGDITTADVIFELGAEYTENDLLTFSLSAGSVADSFDALPASIVANSGSTSITFGKLATLADSVIYRVTNVDNPDLLGTTGIVVDFAAGIDVDGDVIAAGTNIELCATATTAVGGITFDTDCMDVAAVEDQFTNVSVTTGFDGEIDVTNMRETFTGANTLEDTLVISHTTEDTTGWASYVDPGIVTLVLKGDFTDLTESQFTSGATTTDLNDDENELTLTYPSTLTTDTITFTSDGTGSGVSLIKQSFELDASQSYTCGAGCSGDADVASLGMGTDAGEWTLNGADINIPYMPYVDLELSNSERAIGQIIYVTNHGSQSGDIFVTATAEDGTVVLNNVQIDSIDGGEMRKIAPLIRDELLAEDFTDGKLSIDVTVNAADEDITVYAAYKHNTEADRGVIITDQYKKNND